VLIITTKRHNSTNNFSPSRGSIGFPFKSGSARMP
jgi:hypothetical protein